MHTIDSKPLQKELYTIDAFLEAYGLSRSVYYSEVKKGNLRVTRLGAKPYIKRTDAEKWLSEIGKY